MKIAIIWLWLLTIPVLVTAAYGDELQVQQFSDPNHPKMLAWKVDYVLPDDTGKLQIDLDYDYWDPKVEGDAFSKKSLNSAKIAAEPGSTVSFEVLLSAKESLIIFNGKEYHGKGTALILDNRAKKPSRPTINGGTGGFYVSLESRPQKATRPGYLLF
jgi:hypothetical protein